MDYHGEANLNFCCLEKHLKEVQKSVQVVQDKQGLAETQKELAKLQIVHEDSAQKSEDTASSILMTKENDGSLPLGKHVLALVPLHQVNAVQSLAMQFQSCNGLFLQQLVPVSLSTQQEQQHLNQPTMYCMQSQSHLEHRQAQPFPPAPQSLQSHTQIRMRQQELQDDAERMKKKQTAASTDAVTTARVECCDTGGTSILARRFWARRKGDTQLLGSKGRSFWASRPGRSFSAARAFGRQREELLGVKGRSFWATKGPFG